MATSLPPTSGGARASITVDVKSLQAAPQVAKAAATATSRAIAAAFKAAEAAQKQAVAQAQGALAQIRGQEARATAAARAESSIRIVAARAESAQKQQAARADAAARIEAERRVTAQVKAEIRARESAARQSARAQQATRGMGGQAAAAFAGAAFAGPLGAVAGAVAGGPVGLAIAGGLAAREVARFSGEAVKAASDLEESINKTGVAFAESAAGVLEWSKTSAQAFGQSRAQALEAVSTFGLLFSTIGLGTQESAKMSQRLTELAADIASINNIGVDEALIKLRAGLVGEVEPLRTVGVLLNAQVVSQKAVEMGLARTSGEVTEQAKVMARYQLILDQTQLTQGDFARTSADLANAQRIARAEAQDAQAAFGQMIQPAALEGVRMYTRAVIALGNVLEWVGGLNFGSAQTGNQAFAARFSGIPAHLAPREGQRTRMGPNIGAAARARETSAASAGRSFDADQTSAIRDWSAGVQRIERDANSARLDATRSHEQQRSRAIEQYALANAREEEDFQRSRARAAQSLAREIADVGRAAAAREAEWAEELGKRVAEIRADSHAKIADAERDYARDRERAQRDHRDRLLDAAARLDAAGVFEEQRRFSRESQDAEDDHRDAMSNERRQLQERIDQENEAHEERLNDARKADARRIEEMRESLAEAQRIEDEDRAIRQDRQAADFARQLSEMDAAHAERLAQINQQAAEERLAHHEAFQARLAELGIQNETLKRMDEARANAAIRSFDKFWDAVEARFASVEAARAREAAARAGGGAGFGPYRPEFADGGPVRHTGLAKVHAGEFVLSREMVAQALRPLPFADQRGMQGGVTFRGDVHVSIAGGTNMGRGEMYAVAKQAFTDALTELGGAA